MPALSLSVQRLSSGDFERRVAFLPSLQQSTVFLYSSKGYTSFRVPTETDTKISIIGRKLLQRKAEREGITSCCRCGRGCHRWCHVESLPLQGLFGLKGFKGDWRGFNPLLYKFV
jgi:hypothetical protein